MKIKHKDAYTLGMEEPLEVLKEETLVSFKQTLKEVGVITQVLRGR